MGQIAVITGASSGIGKEFAFQLAEKNYDLVINSRSEEKLTQIKKELEDKFEVSVEIFVADLSKRDEIERLCKYLFEINGLKLLINNAGFGLPQKFMELDYERHQEMIDVHVTAVTKLTYSALKIFRKNDQTGDIITVASVAAFIGSGMYSGTKNFQVHLMKRLQKQHKDMNIRFQALCPGYTITGFHHTDDYNKLEVKQNVSKFLWLDKEFVVKESLKKLRKGKTVVIPSWKYKLIVFLGKLGIIQR